MKKLIFGALVAAMSFGLYAGDDNSVTTNVYNFTMSTRIPYLNAGLRTYASQSFKGYMYLEYSGQSLENVWLDVQNRKTKVDHLAQLGDSFFYNLMGKTATQSLRSVPTVWFEGGDILAAAQDGSDGHELFKKIILAGTGKLKYVRTVKGGCVPCGEAWDDQYCNALYTMNGYVTGVMDCQCPEGGYWHTLKGSLCGVFLSDVEIPTSYEPQHDASFWGSWKATFNQKLSDQKLR